MSRTLSRIQPAALVEALGPVLAEELGAPVRISAVERLKGGYSREMWSFAAAVAGETPRRMVLCADADNGVVDAARALTRPQEFRLLRAAAAAGVAVPGAVCSAEAGNAIGPAYLVMDLVPGTSAVGPLVRDPWFTERREEIAAQKASILASIHAMPVPVEVFGASGGAVAPGPQEAASWASALDGTPAARSGTVTAALAWLGAHPPAPPSRPAVVHGDFRTGNFLYTRAGITAVLDWELAHVGDPLEDVAYAQLACWRVGTSRVGGLVEPERWAELYAAASGRDVDPEVVRYWHVVAAVKITALTWRVLPLLPAGTERDLLRRLVGDVERELRELVQGD